MISYNFVKILCKCTGDEQKVRKLKINKYYYYTINVFVHIYKTDDKV